MCNAFNHPPSCKCGWGPKEGFGALAGVGFEWTRPIKSYESFVNPNARCPKCRDKVYFYRSPDGGAVYFDRLGPPWPKHPCMDTSAPKIIEPIPLNIAGFLMRCPPPDEEGWRPLVPSLIRREFATFFIKVDHPEFPGRYLALSLPLAGCSPIYWRRRSDIGDTEVEVSLLDKDRFGGFRIWTDVLPVAQSFEEAKKLSKSLADKFRAR